MPNRAILTRMSLHMPRPAARCKHGAQSVDSDGFTIYTYVYFMQ